ncbi:MAG TPA: response regulator [Patescibacteria group bacterium]|nr:response regulator [Patescibacteria group bacterium]
MTNTKLQALIIEDEPLAAEMLIEFCSDKVEVITIARDYEQALRSIKNFRPDLLFLDIELPYGKTGFDVLEAVDPQVECFPLSAPRAAIYIV